MTKISQKVKMRECIDHMKNGYDSYTFDEYTRMEKELEDGINKLIQDTRNKYCVIPVLELIEPDLVSVWIINKHGRLVAED